MWGRPFALQPAHLAEEGQAQPNPSEKIVRMGEQAASAQKAQELANRPIPPLFGGPFEGMDQRGPLKSGHDGKQVQARENPAEPEPEQEVDAEESASAAPAAEEAQENPAAAEDDVSLGDSEPEASSKSERAAAIGAGVGAAIAQVVPVVASILGPQQVTPLDIPPDVYQEVTPQPEPKPKIPWGLVAAGGAVVLLVGVGLVLLAKGNDEDED